MNSPGPYNNTANGPCRNVFQIYFYLAGIAASQVSLFRIVDRTTLVGGVTETINKSDTPDPRLVLPLGDSIIGVADCPGSTKNVTPAEYPISYHAHFILGAWDSVANAVLATITYDVTIDKQAIDDANPTNTFQVTATQIF